MRLDTDAVPDQGLFTIMQQSVGPFLQVIQVGESAQMV